MGDIVAIAFKGLAVLSILLLGLGLLRRNRPLTMLGASLLGSVILTWVLGLLGFPVGIVFGFLGTGALFRRRPKAPLGPTDGPTAPPGP